jgi:hypothetical protein
MSSIVKIGNIKGDSLPQKYGTLSHLAEKELSRMGLIFLRVNLFAG